MSKEEAEAFIEKLLQEGLLKEENKHIWSMIRPERLKRMYDVLNQRTRYVSVLLEAVDNGHNQAAVLRSSDAFGIQDIYIVLGEAAFEPNKNVTQSAHKWVNINEKPDINTAVKELKEKGYQVLASCLTKDSVPVDEIDLSGPTVLVFGNEHSGLSEEAVNLADGKFVIPMHGFVQSLNISVAAAVTLYQVTKRARRTAGDRYYLSKEEKQELFIRWIKASVSPRVLKMLEADKRQ
ncbi:MAG: RNA methyltransferase [Desulfotomaculum sp.]|nr:RNA methyltransferase [Desulfotomaculum sp.]